MDCVIIVRKCCTEVGMLAYIIEATWYDSWTVLCDIAMRCTAVTQL